jgi:hypothetical protein
MSNYLAVATVTETLAQIIRDAVLPVVNGAEVTTDRPDRAGGKDAGGRVNLYLFQTAHNAALRNSDLPMRTAAGLPAGRPRAALDLFYLVTFFGRDEQLVAQQLMGLSVAALHATAVLTADQVARAVRAAPGGFLDASDLVQQGQPVTVTPMNLSLEELSKLWSVMFQVPYNLTVAYQCSVVLLDAGPPVPPALPIRAVGPAIHPAGPSVDRVSGKDGGPAVYGAPLAIEGSHLGGDGARVRIGPETLAPAPGGTDTQLTVPLTGNGLRAGVQWLTVEAGGTASRAVPFTLSPAPGKISWVRKESRADGTLSGTVRVHVDPPVEATQSAVLFLDPLPPKSADALRPPAQGVSRVLPAHPAAPASILEFAVERIVPHKYLVRVAVDGAQSPLQTGPRGTYAAPALGVR